MASRQLRPHLNQIREWVRQGRTDAWIAHQLDVSSDEIAAFKREQSLAGDNGAAPDAASSATVPLEELDLRAEDDAAIAAELEAVLEEREASAAAEGEEAGGDATRSRRRGRRGGRRRRRPAYEATFDHGEEGYGLWLDPAVVDDGVYAEHWAGHRPIAVTITPEQIVITRAGADVEAAAETEAD